MQLPWQRTGKQTILTGNIRGVSTRKSKHKVRMLQELAAESDAWMIGLTESHLTEDVLDGEIKIAGYQIYRVDRTYGTRGGGVILYIKNCVAKRCGFVNGTSFGFVEYITCYIKDFNTVIILLYRPEGYCAQFCEALNELDRFIDGFGSPTPNLIVLGDFNFPGMNWTTGEMQRGSRAEGETLQAARLVAFVEQHCLVQYVEQPTRGTNILDLVLANNEELIFDCRVEDSSMTDHRLIFVETMFTVEEKNALHIRRGLNELNFMDSSVDWSVLSAELEGVNWGDMLRGRTPDDMYLRIVDKLEAVCRLHVPKRNRLTKHKIPKDRKLLMRKKNVKNKKLKRAEDPDEMTKLTRDIRAIEEKLVESINRELEREEMRAVGVIKKNPKYFFSYARSKGQVRSGVGPLERDGCLVGEPEEIVEMLQDQYCGAFSVPKYDSLEDVRHHGGNSPGELNDIEFGIGDLERVMGELSPSASPGPDGVPSVLLSKCKEPLAKALYFLWKESLRVGVIPAKLKEATITPIYKGEGRGVAKNYRPVSLTSHIIKVFERVVVELVVKFLEGNGKMNPNQHGFRKHRSCLSQLVQHHYYILRMVEEGLCADVVYLDFSKAFDKVDHGILLKKLSGIGIAGNAFRWIFDFLVGRRQRVNVSGVQSRAEAVVSGVPQGTVLGPVLFLVHVLDIDERVHNSIVSSFADDTRILKAVKSEEHRCQLQQDLCQIYRWAEANNMVFNTTKFEHIRYSVGAVDHMRESEYEAPGSVAIERTHEVKDLGVLLEDNLGFSSHIGKVTGTARKKLGWVLRTFRTRRRDHMLILYKSLILPHLEYCCQLWSPKELGEIRKLEAVQRTFTYRIEGLRESNYWERLSELRLYSLERRRERYMIIYIYGK